MTKLVDEGIFMLDGGGAYCVAKLLYPDAKSFCHAVIMEYEPDYLGGLDYMVSHTKLAYAHHRVGYPEWDALGDEPSSWWQIEEKQGRGGSPVWYLDLK